MNHDTFKKGIADIKNIQLSKEERAFILADILREKVKSPYFSSYRSLYAIAVRMRQSKLYALSFAIILLVSGGGSVVLAAERSLPGDILYPIKVNITEPALDKIYTIAEDRARWESEKTARRFREAEVLALEGRLDAETSKTIEEKIREHKETFHAIVSDLSTTTKPERRESVEVEYESKVKAHSRILDRIKEHSSEETKETIKYVERTLSEELGKNEEREEEREREKREKEKERAEVMEEDLNERLEDVEESIETAAENIKKERVNLRGLRESISETILEESDNIIREARSKIYKARETRSRGDADEEETVSDIEDFERKIFETNTMLEEIKKIHRPEKKREKNKREKQRS